MFSFSCLKCQSTNLDESEIVSLSCKHTFCWSCIESYLISNLSPKIECPLSTCRKIISDHILRKVLSENKIEEYEKLCLESFIKIETNSFKCLFPECQNVGYCDSKELKFECTICKLFNCVMCNATHPFLSCKDYQKKSRSAVNNLRDRDELKAMKEKEFAKALKELNDLKRKRLLATSKEMELLNSVPNDEIFTCSTCIRNVPKGVGIKLRSCFHMFCKECLRSGIINSIVIPKVCLESSCKAKLEDREIRAVLNDKEYDNYHQKSLMQAQFQLTNVFHCQTPDCMFYIIIEDDKRKEFLCPTCKSTNCVSCVTVHKDNETCDQFLKRKSPDLKTLEFIENQIKEGKCMKCPKCGSLIKKSGGCNWIQCPSCKLELCWVLKIPRWGPKGRGDTSGGCRCLVNNNKTCHKDCLYGCMPE